MPRTSLNHSETLLVIKGLQGGYAFNPQGQWTTADAEHKVAIGGKGSIEGDEAARFTSPRRSRQMRRGHPDKGGIT